MTDGMRGTGSPWIRNTSRQPDEDVGLLVRFATHGVDMHRVCVNVKGGHGLSARAYDGVPSISNAPRGARYLVTIKVGTDVRFPVGPTTETVRPRTKWDHATDFRSSPTPTGASGWSQPPPTRRSTSTNTATARVAQRLIASASQKRRSIDTGVASRGWVN